MGIQSPDKLESSLATIIGNIINEQEIGVDKVLINMQREVCMTNPPLFGEVNLILGNIELSAAEVNLVNAFSRETILRQLVDCLRNKYDYILIDCMPSLGMLRCVLFTPEMSSSTLAHPCSSNVIPMVSGLCLSINEINLPVSTKLINTILNKAFLNYTSL